MFCTFTLSSLGTPKTESQGLLCYVFLVMLSAVTEAAPREYHCFAFSSRIKREWHNDWWSPPDALRPPYIMPHRTTLEKFATWRFLLYCYVKICQLFYKLSGGVFQCWIATVRGSVQVYKGARLMTHSILYQVAFKALMINLPSWWYGQKFEEIWEFILLASSICNIWAKRGKLKHCTMGA